MNRYIVIDKIDKDEFISNYFIINYLNIGKSNELRLDNLSINNPLCLKQCIVYLDDEIELIKKYHPKATILPYFGRVDKLKKIFNNDMDVSKRGFSWSLF